MKYAVIYLMQRFPLYLEEPRSTGMFVFLDDSSALTPLVVVLRCRHEVSI